MLDKIEDNTVAVHVWPDGQWCFAEDIEEYTWMSDDYQTTYVPESWDDEDIGEFIRLHHYSVVDASGERYSVWCDDVEF